MDFSRVTAMSYGGRSVSSVWFRGVQVWPTVQPTTTYYFAFRLINQGSYLTWSQFQAENWDSIRLNDDMWTNEETFTKNQVGHITDGSGNTVFYLSTTNSSYSGGGYVYLNSTDWEYTNGLLQNAATTNTLSAFNTAGINNIDGMNVGEIVEPTPTISDGLYTFSNLTGSGSLYLQWEVWYEYYDPGPGETIHVTISDALAINGNEYNINYNGDGSDWTYAWGSDPNLETYTMPIELQGTTVTFHWWFDAGAIDYSQYPEGRPVGGGEHSGTVNVYVPSMDDPDYNPYFAVQMPSISD